MLRRFSIIAASAALVGGLCAIPALASQDGHGAKHASSGSFNVPAASNALKGWGSYHQINAHRVHVQVCAKRLRNVFAVAVEAVAYNANYSKHAAIAVVLLPETPGATSGLCTQTNLIYTAHLKVFSFLGNGGFITKKTPMKSIY